MPSSQRRPRLLCGGFISDGGRGAEVLVRASSSKTAEGSGGPPAPRGAMRRPTGEQCFQSKPDLVMMGSLLGLPKTRPQTP